MTVRTVCGAVVLLSLGGFLGFTGVAGRETVREAASVRSELPSSKRAKALLNATHRHGEWVRVPVGSQDNVAWVVYPDRSDKAPVALLTARNEGMTDWLRGVADQISLEGYIAVVPDVLFGVGITGGYADSGEDAAHMRRAISKLSATEIKRRILAAREYGLLNQASNGEVVDLEFDRLGDRPQVTVRRYSPNSVSRERAFDASAEFWPTIIAFANVLSGNTRPHAAGSSDESHVVHMMPHNAQRSAAAQTPGAQRGYPAGKLDHLPAGLFNAASVVARSQMRSEWVDIPFQNRRLHTRIVYPNGAGRAGVVILMQHGPGLDAAMLAYADQLARQGFISVAPDLHSGLGPNGGNFDSFQFTDDVMKANAQLTVDDMQARYRAARDYALKLPRANGMSASMGFCMGGTNSWRMAAAVPELSAAVVFYGGPVDAGAMTSIKAPVIGFYGEDDARLTSTVTGTAARMKELGKSFEYHIYPHATHGFLYFQDLAGNPQATEHSWNRAIAFLQQHLN